MKTRSNNENAPKSFVRWDEVKQRTRLSRMTVWRLETAGHFPKRVQIAARSVAWVREEFEQWIEDQVNQTTNSAAYRFLNK